MQAVIRSQLFFGDAVEIREIRQTACAFVSNYPKSGSLPGSFPCACSNLLLSGLCVCPSLTLLWMRAACHRATASMILEKKVALSSGVENGVAVA